MSTKHFCILFMNTMHILGNTSGTNIDKCTSSITIHLHYLSAPNANNTMSLLTCIDLVINICHLSLFSIKTIISDSDWMFSFKAVPHILYYYYKSGLK